MAEQPPTSPTLTDSDPTPATLADMPPPSGARRRARLIPDWTSAWRLWSVRIATFGAGLMATWPSLPPSLLRMLPYSEQIAAGIFVTIMLARLIPQDIQAQKGIDRQDFILDDMT